MNKELEKEIQSLEMRIQQLKAEKEKTEKEKAVLTDAYSRLKDQLKEEGVSMEAFVRFAFKDLSRAIAVVQRESETGAPAAQEPARRKVSAKKKVVRKPRARKGRVAAGAIKIPAGKYTNIPPDTAAVFEVKEKGPRPKAVKAHAEQLGIDAFLDQCRIGE
jgi:hypothetical protein